MKNFYLLIAILFGAISTIDAQVDFSKYNLQNSDIQNIEKVIPTLEANWGKKLKGKIMSGPDYNNAKESMDEMRKNNNPLIPNSTSVSLCPPLGEEVIVNFEGSGATAEARRAFQYAADIWARTLNLAVPVTVDFTFAPLAPNVIGSAGPNGFWNFGIVYPTALANQLVGADLDPLGADMSITFSSTFPFYFGLDGNPPPGTIDFVTIVLHEMGHGLGFLSSDFVFNANDFPGILGPGHPGGACIGFGGGTLPYVYDLFLSNASFGGLDPYAAAATDPSVTPIPGFGGCFFGLDTYFTNDDLTFVGPNTVSCFGEAPEIYAPSPYRDGSSISHFNDSFVAGTSNGLLGPFYRNAVHTPGCALATFQDLMSPFGYNIAPSNVVPECDIVPTMGEWGLMSLGLLLLILGVVTIKSRQILTA